MDAEKISDSGQTLEVVTSTATLRARLSQARRAGQRVAFVPTMGYLHEGHLSLMRLARQRAEVLITSIFVNPTQFAPGEDLTSYPRDLDRDVLLCQRVGVDLVFAPGAEVMYPSGAQTIVRVTEMTQGLCGASRPTHFQGVATIVAKLFNLVQPDLAVFGEKDYQQLAVIRRMVRDLNFPIEIVGGPIVREDDGLAMSSRNVYLSSEQRAQAPALHAALQRCAALVARGQRDGEALLAAARAMIEAQPLARVDYIELVDPDHLTPITTVGAGGAVMALAVFFGDTRLIDNKHLDVASMGAADQV